MLNMYYTIMSNMSSYPIRDWMITRYIMHGFEAYSFDEAESVYRDFLPKCVVKAYHDTLTGFYNTVKALKKGNIAPGFLLKDTTGREVSLHELTGKIVYIDFWGVYCGPCIVDIRNFVPQLHKKYQGRDVVFVNICVASGKTEPSWKNKVRELGLDGINLLAPDWSANPVCTIYNIIGIPHYVLIDRQGRIASANAPDPQRLLGAAENDIDRLLGK
jgi:peroxiredoxin